MSDSELVVVDHKRLGRKKPTHDPTRLSLRRYTDTDQLPAAPPVWDASAHVSVLGMMLNDTLGCCTCSEAGHAVQIWTAIASTGEATVPDSAVEALYEAVGGYVPGNPSTDNGCVISDVLAYLRSTGIDGHKIGAYGSIEVTDTELAEQALYVFGGLDAGWSMPIAAQQMSGTWDVPEGQALTGDWAPGSWGGHCTLAAAYLANGNWKVASWGQWFEVTPAFVKAYLEELWAVASPDWIEANGTSPDGGFNTAQLDTDVNSLNDSPAPGPAPSAPTFIEHLEQEIRALAEECPAAVEEVGALFKRLYEEITG